MLVVPKRSDDPVYIRRELSNREGFRRMELAQEKLEQRARGMEKLCDICGRRTRAYRLVPATFGTKLGPTRAGLSGGLTGRKFALCCDGQDHSCARSLERVGVPEKAIAEQEAMDRLGLVLP